MAPLRGEGWNPGNARRRTELGMWKCIQYLLHGLFSHMLHVLQCGWWTSALNGQREGREFVLAEVISPFTLLLSLNRPRLRSPCSKIDPSVVVDDQGSILGAKIGIQLPVKITVVTQNWWGQMLLQRFDGWKIPIFAPSFRALTNNAGCDLN